ncbi:dTDP-4-amino-4,6-dideoxygalactose transaminase [Indioceanicola profundi]|uniref:dTDP-4-amino-4,6-dideoxygalactose transaminase n=1 Tax=Indioceanicola profundi TaxID=2220096 RepID=UPI000E6ABA9D|nr:dTDP-4-amino-4,6-dideoxygalactose transaminase [Indioceanicola profundi]
MIPDSRTVGSLSDAVEFHRPYLTGREPAALAEVLTGTMHGGGTATRRCQDMLSRMHNDAPVLLTLSCTAALEMSALLLDLRPGDEVIVPSFTFVSSASAFALRGAVPVFADARPEDMTIDPVQVEAAITPRTKAICVVHYAGAPCAIDELKAIAGAHGLRLIEDAAQSIGADFYGRPLGTFGDLAAVSFHATKNIHCGEGGALIINDPELVERAEVLWEKGTNRKRWVRGEIDKYTWIDLGSSFLPSELQAGMLSVQLEDVERVTAARRDLWDTYMRELAPLSGSGRFELPQLGPGIGHNGHIFFLRFTDMDRADRFTASMAEARIKVFRHYVALHDTPAGRRLGRANGDCPVTRHAENCLIRLPMWPGVDIQRVLDAAMKALA